VNGFTNAWLAEDWRYTENSALTAYVVARKTVTAEPQAHWLLNRAKLTTVAMTTLSTDNSE